MSLSTTRRHFLRSVGHYAFDRDHNTPAARIFVAMLQRLGIETDEFASGMLNCVLVKMIRF